MKERSGWEIQHELPSFVLSFICFSAEAAHEPMGNCGLLSQKVRCKYSLKARSRYSFATTERRNHCFPLHYEFSLHKVGLPSQECPSFSEEHTCGFCQLSLPFFLLPGLPRVCATVAPCCFLSLWCNAICAVLTRLWTRWLGGGVTCVLTPSAVIEEKWNWFLQHFSTHH